ncbi:MAG: DUF6878 family protein [Bauldia sp.]
MSDTDTTSMPSPDFADWRREQDNHDRIAKELRTVNKTTLFDALSAAGLTIVTVSFDGYGDSGQVENIEGKVGDDAVDLPSGTIEIASPAWASTDIKRQAETIPEAIEALAYDFLGATHCGWENNDGAYGEFTFDVAARTITLDYNERYTSSENYTHEL